KVDNSFASRGEAQIKMLGDPMSRMRVFGRSRVAVTFAAGLVALTGCASTEDTFFLETIELQGGELFLKKDDETGEPSPQLKGVSVDAKQRFVWSPEVPIRQPVAVSQGGYSEYEVKPRSIVCAEPSPDAASAIAAEIGAAVKAKAGQALPGAAVDASFEQNLTESVQNISQRTQTIQLMRDTLYRACEAYANGALDSFGYAMILSQFDVFMVQLLGIDALGNGTKRRGPGGPGGHGGGGRGAAYDGINNIVQSSMLGTTNPAPGRVTRTACLMWFAQHPQIKIRRVGGVAEIVGQDVPVIADLCLRVVESAINVERVQQARQAGATPQQVQDLYDALAQ
ncbi:MAG: hypothetical protein AAFQ73_16070, partial [Pseudomonadota bacterium]